MKIVRARPEDAPRLTEIAFAAKRHWGYPERWIAKWADLLTITPELVGERETYTAYVDGDAVGFYSLSLSAARDDEGEVGRYTGRSSKETGLPSTPTLPPRERGRNLVASTGSDREGFQSPQESFPSGMIHICLEHLWVLPGAMGRGVGRALFEHAVERVKALGLGALEIESDPNAAGFYEHMGARRVATTVTELEGKPRELPVLVYELD